MLDKNRKPLFPQLGTKKNISEKNLKGGPFGDIKKFSSRTVPKKNRKERGTLWSRSVLYVTLKKT